MKDTSSSRDNIEHGGSIFEGHLDAVDGLHLRGDPEAANNDVVPDSQEPPLHPRLQKEADWQKTRDQVDKARVQRRLARKRLAALQSDSFVLHEAEEASESEIEDEGDGEVDDDDAMTLYSEKDNEEDDEAASQSSFIDNRPVLSDHDGYDGTDDDTDDEGNSEDSDDENGNDEARSDEEEEGEEIDESEIDDIVNQAYDVAASAIRSRYRVRAQFFYDDDELERNEVSTFNYNERFLLVGS